MVKLWIEYDKKSRKEALILFDEEDLRLVSPFYWYITTGPSGQQYATMRPSFLSEYMLMHRWILNAPDDMVVHHLNHNSLDNRKTNLIILSASDHSYYHAKTRHKRNRELFSTSLK